MDSWLKRLGILMSGAALLLVTAIAPTAHAQGLLGPAVSGLPFLGGSSSEYCGATTGCCEPYCPPGLKLDAGYLWGRRAVHFGITSSVGTFVLEHPLEGLQVGATLQAPLRDNLGVILRGTWLFPSNGTAELDLDLFTGGSASLDWSTKIQYYTVEGAAVYPFCAPLNFLAGFRFDSFSTDLTNPRSTSAFFAATLSGDQGDLTLNSYIPYVGIGLNGGQSLRVSFIGTPYFWGTRTFQRTVGPATSFRHKTNLQNTYFAEASAEYGLSVGPGTAAVLAKWTYMHGSGNPTFEQTVGGIVLEEETSTDLIRRHFYLGGSFTLALPSPL